MTVEDEGTRQAPLLTFPNLRSLITQNTMCRGNDNILILHHLAAFCQKNTFLKQNTKLQITMEWRKENVEGNTEEETESEEDDGLKQVVGSNSEHGGNAFHWKMNSVLVVHGANEVF
jgi:hypothetical protein